MKTLLLNGKVINVFTKEIEQLNILIENEKIIGVGDYTNEEVDNVVDVSDKYICPGFIDGHIHIESTMMTPPEFTKVCVPHGTTTVVADPHEIANVCGKAGIDYMLEASENIPLTVYYMLPSCVPATPFDEAGAVLDADDLMQLYQNERVLGLGEMMNYSGVIGKDGEVIKKINDALALKKIVNGHAPLLTGEDLDKYISAGINDDHECSTADEAKERIKKGQWIMIRQGTAAKNLEGLMPLFQEPYCYRCLLVTDDKHPADLLKNGHIDSIIREAVRLGKKEDRLSNVIKAISMATIQAATCFGLHGVGAIAPGYIADLLVLDDLYDVKVSKVYHQGQCVADDGKLIEFKLPQISADLKKSVGNSFYLNKLKPEDFTINKRGEKCLVIGVIKKQLLTQKRILDIDFENGNGVDLKRDILKIAVIERHLCTGHIGLGFIQGIGIKAGAIASSVSHDSHNLIVIGTNEDDMAMAANCIREMGGGNVVVNNEKVIEKMPLEVAGLMSRLAAKELAMQNSNVRKAAHRLGANEGIEPFMNMAFVSLPVIPSLKMTTKGLIDVDNQRLVDLFVKD